VEILYLPGHLFSHSRPLGEKYAGICTACRVRPDD
jgi:hypothetical protein